jgi:hypothetical protein
MLAIAAISVGRLILGMIGNRRFSLDSDVLHAAMGLSMAGMLVTRLVILPSTVWVAVFGFAAMWFGWQFARAARKALTLNLFGHGVAHIAGSAAMVYMFVATPPNPSMVDLICGGRAASMVQLTSIPPAWPVAALVLGLIIMAATVWLPRYRVTMSPASPSAGWASPEGTPGGRVRRALLPALSSRSLTASCQVVMGVTMTVMLLTLYR